jgi:putative RecB family exonuclease
MDEDRQLALYQIGIQNSWNGVDQVELVWHYVAFDKEIRSKRTEEELDALKKIPLI